MGQKINPISLRLHYANRNFDDCWYSDHFYSYLVSQDIKTRLYLNSILKQITYPSARFYIQTYQKKTKIFVFFCSPTKSRKVRSKLFKLKQFNVTKKTKFKIENLNTVKQSKNPISSYKIDKIHKRIGYTFCRPKLGTASRIQGETQPTTVHSISPVFTHILRNCRRVQNTEQIAKNIYFRYFLLHHFLLKNLVEIIINQPTSKKENLMATIFYSVFLKKKLNKLQNYGQISSFLTKKIHYNKKSETNDQSSKNKLPHKRVLAANKDYNRSRFSTINSNILGEKGKSFQLIDSFNHKMDHLEETNLNHTLQSCANSNVYKITKITGVTSAITGNQFFSFLGHNLTYRNHFEYTLYKQLGLDFSIYPIKIYNDYRSALFLAEEIVHYIQRRVPFRRIKNRILKEVLFYSGVKGIRIACSGRVGGRSKKAQKAKTECIKYGQTSLHVFSSYIDFASKTALTPFGSVGVKVWICFQ